MGQGPYQGWVRLCESICETIWPAPLCLPAWTLSPVDLVGHLCARASSAGEGERAREMSKVGEVRRGASRCVEVAAAQ